MEEVKKARLFTSYYGKLKSLEKAGIVSISISLSPPSWFNGITLLELAPSWDMMKISKAKYEVAYREKLEKVNFNYIFRHIKSVSRGKDVALLCFESLKTGRDDDWCHRTMLADWMKEKYHFTIDEWSDPKDLISEEKLREKQIKEQREKELKESQRSLF